MLLLVVFQALADWLHSFGGGQMLQKRLIFNIINKAMPNATNNTGSNSNSSSSSVMDHLSILFNTISNMCRDMFSLIRQVLIDKIPYHTTPYHPISHHFIAVVSAFYISIF